MSTKSGFVLLMVVVFTGIVSGHPGHGDIRLTRVNEIYFLVGQKQFQEALNQATGLMRDASDHAEGYYCFCLIMNRLNRLDYAENYFREKTEQQPENAFFQFALGMVYKFQTRYEQALTHLERAIRINPRQRLFYDVFLSTVNFLSAEERGLAFLQELFRKDPANHFLASSIAEMYLDLDIGRFSEWLQKAESLAPDYVPTVILRLNMLSMMGRDADALALAKEWVDRMHARGMLREETYFCMMVANFHLILNHFEEFLDTASKTFNLAQIICDDELERYVEELYAQYYGFVLGYYPVALEYLQNILRYSERTRYVKNQIDAYDQMGDIYQVTGDYQHAMDSYNQALVLSLKIDNKLYQAQSLIKLANLLTWFNELDEAREYFNRALKLTRETGYTAMEGVVLRSLGVVADSQDKPKEGMAYYDQAMKIAETYHQDTLRATIFLDMGLNFLETDQPDQVMPNMKKALALYRKLDFPSGVGNACRMIGYALYRQKHYKEALPWYQQAIDISRQLNTSPALAYSLTGMGSCYRKLKHLDKAVHYYENALTLLEDSQNNLQTYDLKIPLGEDLFPYYENLLVIYAGWYEKNHKPEDLAKAFALSEKAKARNLASDIARSRLVQRLSTISPENKEKMLLLNKRLELKYQEFARFIQDGGDRSDPRAFALKAQIALLEKERHAFMGKMRRENPRLAQLIQPATLSLDALKKQIEPGSAVIEYFVGKEALYYWIIRPDKVVYGKFDLGRKQLLEMLKKASWHLYSPAKRQSDQGAYLRNPRWAGLNMPALNELYRRLMAPLEGELKGIHRLRIVPDDKLHYLPFEMLVSGFRDDGTPRFLVDTYAIDYLPYAGIIDLLQSTPDQRKENVLAVGNPEFKNPSKSKASGEDPVPASLPYSGREADRITSMIPHSRLLVGEDASEQNFRKYAGAYRVLHLSTHSFLDDRQPFYSRLAFAGDSRDNDGNLYTYEIFNLNIKAELVVLSACETGCGKLSRGEGIVGLSRAFMFAGASSLVVSLWPVGDRGTSRLMSEFYRHLWQGDDKMTALRKAKMSLIDSGEFSDPFYWAPFILIGDPQPLHFRKNSGWQSWLLWLVMGMLAVSVGVGLRVRRR